jgi:hypothetical protein
MPEPWVLSVPLAKGHWVTLVSSKPMTLEAFAKFDRFLAIQKETLVDERADAEAIAARRAKTPKAVECEARQSGHDSGIAQTQSQSID